MLVGNARWSGATDSLISVRRMVSWGYKDQAVMLNSQSKVTTESSNKAWERAVSRWTR